MRRSLQGPGGATVAALAATTGWQAHAVRAALSGLRKKGWLITRRHDRVDTIYAIDPEAPGPGSETDVVPVLEAASSPPKPSSDTSSAVVMMDGGA